MKPLYAMNRIGLLMGAMLACAVAHGDGGRPNILYIMSDDHSAEAIGAYGSRLTSLNPTPTLDKLAAEGMVLENTFCNNAVCSPSRASILTGQYSHVNGEESGGQGGGSKSDASAQDARGGLPDGRDR